jgi:hypothetical protein
VARNEAWGRRMCGQYSNDQFTAHFFRLLLSGDSLLVEVSWKNV